MHSEQQATVSKCGSPIQEEPIEDYGGSTEVDEEDTDDEIDRYLIIFSCVGIRLLFCNRF